jgi:hypothetical protein
MSDSNSTLTQSRLMELLHYNPATGEFRWRINVSSTGRAGHIAGCVNRAGYVVIRLDRKLYLAHRLVFLYMEGAFPPSLVDHIDMAKSNNRWSNLRHATKSENGQNRIAAQRNNRRSGVLGVYWSDANQAWGAKVVVNGRQHHGGFYPTKALASAAHLALKRRLHPYGMI